MIGESKERVMGFAQAGHFMEVKVFGLGGVFAHAVKEDDFGTTMVTELLQRLFDFLTGRNTYAGQNRLACTGDFTEHGKVVELEGGHLVKGRKYTFLQKINGGFVKGRAE